MSNVANFNAMDAAALASMAPNAISIAYNEKLRRSTGNNGSVLKKFEGPDGALGFPLVRQTDLTTRPGYVVHFTTAGGINGPPVLGDNVLQGNEQTPLFGTYAVRVDTVRNGLATTRNALRGMTTGKSVPAVIGDMLDEWLGRTRDQFAFQRWMQRAVSGWNTYLPNNRASIGALTDTDVLTTNVIERVTAMLTNLDAKPIQNATAKNGAPVPRFLFLGPNDVCQSLYGDSLYQDRNLHAEVRGDANSMNTGGLEDWRGQKIYPFISPTGDWDGPIGSYLAPKAKLSGSIISSSNVPGITAGTAALVLTGGGSRYTSGVDYFRYWPGNTGDGAKQYKSESITSDADDWFVKIFNHVNSPGNTDAGKWGFYRYVGTTGNPAGIQITTAAYSSATGKGGGRLSGTANTSGSTRHTTVGSVVWDAAVNTDEHPVGAPMFLCNKLGNVLGNVIACGTEAMLIAYGGGAEGDPSASFAGRTSYMPKNMMLPGSMMFTDSNDYGMRIASDIEAVMGLDVSLDTAGLPRGFVRIPCTYNPPEIVAN